MKYKKVIIFGASQGIGKALAYGYHSAGAKLVLLSRNTEALEKIANETDSYYMKCDITDRENVKKSVEYSLNLLNTIDLVIINSGVGGPLWMKDFTSEKLKEIYNVNVFGTANVLEFILPLMKNQGYGTIAGISSLADVRGYSGSGAYSSSKAALSTLLEAARVELKKYNIKVITVRPGFVKTAMTANNEFRMPFIMSPEKAAEKIRKGIEAGKPVVQFPFPIVLATKIVKILPVRLFDLTMGRLRPEADTKSQGTSHQKS
ncbi:MAG: SDR family NAD(P)-dependent oxidoreductase [Ignavibacteria bacterium]|nr:SDR family NAD(P)-dependent oxidoreductase [Ignavibacteria bacterium]